MVSYEGPNSSVCTGACLSGALHKGKWVAWWGFVKAIEGTGGGRNCVVVWTLWDVWFGLVREAVCVCCVGVCGVAWDGLREVF